MYAVISQAAPPFNELFVTIDLGDGSVTEIAPIELGIQGLAFDATGTLYFMQVIGPSIGTIDLETGVPTIIGGSGLDGASQTIEFDTAGRMYAAWGSLIEVDPVTGDGTYIGATDKDIRGMAHIVECRADLDGSGEVGAGDLAAVLSAWGDEGGPQDLDCSENVGFGDLFIVLEAWGPCGPT